jgi:hypothetical protein
MSKEEKDAINEKLRNINLDNMRKTMTRKILSDGAISPVESTALPVGASWITAPASIAMGSETLTEEDITGLKQMMEEFREERK